VRIGDAAPMSFVELVGRELEKAESKPEPEKKAKKAKAEAEAAEGGLPKAKRKKSEEATP